ncbi:hypothetical protein [Empedobacter brevis]|uniref:hypothetical protein n=1 Tax=Empedobacter brevis TaxID=247 RepID=UPI003342CFBB
MSVLAPIYGTNGKLLGTDDQGLKGTPIIMKEENFQQGMSHKEALSYSEGLQGLESKEAIKEYSNTQANLKNRPDYDGYLTLSEANEWFRNGNGEPLFVDSSKINLDPVNVSELQEEGGSMYKNFFLTTNQATGKVYGTIKLTLEDSSSGTVKLGGNGGMLDEYNFEQKPKDGSIKRELRNFGTSVGSVVAGQGKDYFIYTYGKGKVSTK